MRRLLAEDSILVSYLGDGDGGAAVGDDGGLRAEGGEGSHDLGGVDHVGAGGGGRVVGIGRSAGGEGKDSSGELHFD